MSSSPDVRSIVFNLAGGAVLLTVVGYMIVSFFTKPSIAACTTRYPAGQQFVLHDDGGQPMTGIELQGRAGSREWGLLKNAKIIGSPAGEILEVTLASTEDEDHASQNGIGFVWPVRELNKASSACLSYSVYIPEGFNFTEPGLLPGLYGASDLAQIDELQPENSFAVRMGWATAGDVGVDVRAPTSGGYWEGASYKTVWPTGRWVTVDQEVILNTIDQEDGALRVWIDGALTINSNGLVMRKFAQSGISGVVSDVGYARTLSDVVGLRLSPFIVQWQ